MPKIADARVLILATNGFEQSELTVPRDELRRAGAKVDVASPEGKPIRGWNLKDWGETVESDCKIADVKPADYDALVLPGGVANPDQLRTDEEAVAFVRGFVESGRPVAAICHAPWTLVEADVVRGRRMTSWPSLQTDLRNAGAEWVDEEVVVDGNLVTSRKPDDLPAFNEAMVELFAH